MDFPTTILLVEEQNSLTKAETKKIEDLGYKLLIVSRTMEAVARAILDSKIHLLLIDLDPDSSPDPLQIAKDIQERVDLPIVFLIDNAEPVLIEKIKGVTPYGFLLRNTNIYIWKSTIEMALALFEAKQRIREAERHHHEIKESTYSITQEKETGIEEKYRALFETMAQGAINYDDQGRIISANPAAERILGIPLEDMQGITEIVLNRKAIRPDYSDFPSKDHPSMVALRTGQHVRDVVMGVFNPVRKAYTWIKINAVPQFKPGESTCHQVYSTFDDITEQKETADILRVRLRLNEYAAGLTLDELLKVALAEAERMTGSQIGFYHFLEADQTTVTLQAWSIRTERNFCQAAGKGKHYHVSEAGVWVDCILERRPVIHNDYAALPHRKGTPDGHAHLIRELVVPVFRDNKIVAVLGVGNKPSDYNEHDIKIVFRLADLTWDIAERKLAEAVKQQLEERFSKAFHTSPDSININRLRDGLYIHVNAGFTSLTGYSSEDVCGKTSLEISVWANPVDRRRMVQGLQKHGEVNNLEAKFRLKNGQIKTGLMSAKLFELNGEMCILSVTRDISERKEAEELLLRTTRELKDAYEATLKGWSDALELREEETAEHSRRVVRHTLELARQLGLSSQEILQAHRGALLHDIGKMGIPDRILLKPGPLTEEEWLIMRTHPVHAYNLLSKIPYLLPALDIPYCHHERWDGSGYPRGLKGESIPLIARIFAVVDVWDALTSERPYRSAWSQSEARSYLIEQAGKKFDARVVELFLRYLESEVEPGEAEDNPL